MGWLTTLPAGVIVEDSHYYESRQKDGDPDTLEYRQRRRLVTEYRGITYAVVQANDTPSAGSNGFISYSARFIAAGGYTLVKVSDLAITGWF